MFFVGPVPKMSVKLLFVFLTLTFFIIVALIIVASHNHNFNGGVQDVSILSCGRPCDDPCSHDYVNGVKSSKTVCDLSVCEVVITDFCIDVANEPIKHVLPCKPVHKSLSSKHLNRANVSTSSVKNNVDISVSCTTTCLDRSSSVFKGCVRYIFAIFLFKCKQEHLSDYEKCFLFHFKSSFRSRENEILEFYIFKFHGIVKYLSIKQEIHFTG